MGATGRKALLLMLAGALLVQTGCGFKDIDKRFFVVSIGVDSTGPQSDKKYRVILKLAIPSPQEKFGSNESLILLQDANTITEAVRVMKSRVDKELDFGHAKAILLGEQLLKENQNLPEIMDWFARRRDIQQIAWMGVARPSAHEILKLKPKTERLPSNMLFLFFGRAGTETAYVVSEYLFDFYRRMHERGIDPILPVIEPKPDEQIAVNKMAFFDKTKYIATLNEEETKMFNTLYEKIGKVDVKVQTDNHDMILAIDTVNSSYTAAGFGKGQEPRLDVNVKLFGVVEETHMAIDMDKLAQYEKLAEKEIGARMERLIRKLQDAGVDPVGFGLKYRAKHRVGVSEWEEWKEKYASLPVNVNVKVKLRGTGIIE